METETSCHTTEGAAWKEGGLAGSLVETVTFPNIDTRFAQWPEGPAYRGVWVDKWR